MSEPIRFLQISDTHFGPDKDFLYHGKNPYLDGLTLLKEIGSLPTPIDFIVHTGDVVSFQSESAYKIAHEVLSQIKAPLYFATGNHDDPKRLNAFPLFATRKKLVDRDSSVSYYFEHRNMLFITIDAKNPDDNDPSGVLAEDVLSALEKLLQNTSTPFCLFTHFPALAIDAPWIDANLLITNGDTLHQLLAKNQKRCRGVFFGHLHQKVQMYKDGIFYTSIPSNTFQFAGWPNDKMITYNAHGHAAINLVTIFDQHVVVKCLEFLRSNDSPLPNKQV